MPLSSIFYFFIIIYLGIIETLVVKEKLSSIGFISFGFPQTTIDLHDFPSTVLNLK